MWRVERAGLGVSARGTGEDEGGGYGRVEDGIADRVEGRHGIPAARTYVFLDIWLLPGSLCAENGLLALVDGSCTRLSLPRPREL